MRLTTNSDRWSQPMDWVAPEREAQVPNEMAKAVEVAHEVGERWLPRSDQRSSAPAIREKVAARQLRWPEMEAAAQALMLTLRTRGDQPSPWLPARRARLAERDCGWLLAEIGDLAQQVRRQFREAHGRTGAPYDAVETQLIRQIVRAHVAAALDWTPPTPKQVQSMGALVHRAQAAMPWLDERYFRGMSAEFCDGETLKLMIEVLGELLT